MGATVCCCLVFSSAASMFHWTVIRTGELLVKFIIWKSLDGSFFLKFGRQVHYATHYRTLRVLFVIFSTNPRFTVYGGGTQKKERKRKMLTCPFPIFPRRKIVLTMFLEGTGGEDGESERRGGGFACFLRHSTLHCTTKRQGGGKRAGFA